MSNWEKFTFNLPDNIADDIVIRLGEAAKVELSKGVRFTGRISAPADYFRQRTSASVDLEGNTHYVSEYGSLVTYPYFNKITTHVKVDTGDGTITLVRNSESPEPDIIVGKLVPNSTIDDLRINKQSPSWDLASLSRYLRLNRHLFTSPADADRIIGELKAASFEIKQSLEASNDSRGTSKNLKAQETKTNLPEFIDLKIPLFVGEPASQIRVFVFLEVINGKPEIFLELPGLDQLLTETMEHLLGEETSVFEENGITVLWA